MSTCVDVLFPSRIGQAYTYLLADANESFVGRRVVAPIGRNQRVGIITAFRHLDSSSAALKPISSVLDDAPFLPHNLIPIIQFISDYYMAPLGDVLRLLVPNGTLPFVEKCVALTQPYSLEEIQPIVGKSKIKYAIYKELLSAGSLAISKLEERVGKACASQVNELERSGTLRVDFEVKDQKIREKIAEYIQPLAAATDVKLRKNAYQQIEIVEYLKKTTEPQLKSDLIRLHNFSRNSLNQLVEKGILSVTQTEIERKSNLPELSGAYDFPFTPEQETAFNAIKQSFATFHPFLLYGVTGSGKTLIYLRVLREMIAAGKTGIVLIPEISLTPQTVARFRAHFGDTIAIMNSRMTDGERYDAWRLLRDGKYSIVIGPRSAIFAPLQNIGVVIVDEEHEWSYKQSEQSPRYNARDIAVFRAKQENCPVILGSATPSMESFHNANLGKYSRLDLLTRPSNAELPDIDIIDLKDELERQPTRESALISEALEDEIERRLLKKEQVILFQNRRGYSAHLTCEACGHVQECPNCSISLVFHKRDHKLACHYCDHTTAVSRQCQKCGSQQLRLGGYGTQKVEEYLHERFPSSRIVRMDLDTTRGKDAHSDILKKFEQGAIDILVGTQMITKGLDFPNVTLVGVLSADASLSIPDFRSSERTYQLLSQVSGRSGRGEKRGLVLIQTFQPDHYVVKHSQVHSYDAFFEEEFAFRSGTTYPPTAKLININLSDSSQQHCGSAAADMADALRKLPLSGIQILGPTPSVLEKLKNRYRFQILIKSESASVDYKRLKVYLVKLADSVRQAHRDLRVVLDVDPYDLL